MFLATVATSVALAAGGAAAGVALERGGKSPLASLGLGPAVDPSPTAESPALVYPDGRPVPVTVPESQSYFGKFATPRLNRTRVPDGQLWSLPGSRGLVALTVDDGASAETIRGYCDFVERTGFRMTFFVTSMYDAWSKNKKQLRRLVESGHIQLANHTWTHEWLTRISDSEVANQLAGCERFLKNTFGVSGHPYYRPPFGDIDSRVMRIASNEGYSTPVLWYGSFGDAGLRTERDIRRLAHRWLQREHIVIGHANFTPVTHCFDYIESLMHQRKLQPVTLDDIYLREV
jgi:peptidoglycan/xylan/chitin deacetylase (PgdA/CDA1 family)